MGEWSGAESGEWELQTQMQRERGGERGAIQGVVAGKSGIAVRRRTGCRVEFEWATGCELAGRGREDAEKLDSAVGEGKFVGKKKFTERGGEVVGKGNSAGDDGWV